MSCKRIKTTNEIDLSNNNITIIPDYIYNLRNLEILDLKKK